MADDLPDTIEWSGQGVANRLRPRGMSDYWRDHGNAEYKTSSGAILMYRSRSTKEDRKEFKGVWQARYRGFSSNWKPSAQEAIASYEMKKNTGNTGETK
jgi:hypothetical protein